MVTEGKTISTVLKGEYLVVQDDSCHRYVIPIEKREDWDAWSQDDEDWDAPMYAVSVDGGDVIFTSFRIG